MKYLKIDKFPIHHEEEEAGRAKIGKSCDRCQEVESAAPSTQTEKHYSQATTHGVLDSTILGWTGCLRCPARTPAAAAAAPKALSLSWPAWPFHPWPASSIGSRPLGRQLGQARRRWGRSSCPGWRRPARTCWQRPRPPGGLGWAGPGRLILKGRKLPKAGICARWALSVGNAIFRPQSRI